MQQSSAPSKLVLPFANSGGKNSIPTASQIGIVAGAASLTDGFPPLTRTPLAAGGVPPSGLDMNGVLFNISALCRWFAVGGSFKYDSTFATDANIGGYPAGATLLRSDGLGTWVNQVDNNITNPESGGVGWVAGPTSGIAAITMTSSNVTLTALQYGKPVIVISGVLTANLNLIFPAFFGEWFVVNNTTGIYSVTCKTASGTGVIIQTGVARRIYGDGTNIYAMDNPSLGYGQAWNVMTASRAIGTIYTNTTDRPISVSVEVQTQLTAGSGCRLLISSLEIAQFYNQVAGATPFGYMTGIVPPGGTYQIVNAAGTNTLTSWLELK